MFSIARLLSVFSIIFLFTSCEENHLEVYEKPITNLFYVLTPDSGQTVVLSFMDNDGIGGKPALVNSGTLQRNTTYHGKLMLGNRNPLASPRLSHVTDSASVAALPEQHQVFFEPTNGLQLYTTYTDLDKNGFPIGMITTLQTAAISEGNLLISIIHNPNKAGTNVMNGDKTRAGGSVDVEANFEITISD